VSRYYKGKRTRNIYLAGDTKPFKLSRSKIDRFIECPRCFYIDRRLGVDRPPGFPFNLNIAVDTLLKKEFDIHRTQNTQHPLLEQNFVGIQHLHESTNLLITGAIDDLWQEPDGDYVVVDYKATSKNDTIDVLDQAWHAGYKRQMEIYQWLLRRTGLEVSDTGYFVYANGSTDSEAFDAQLEFELTLIPYTGSDDWIEGVLEEIHACLNKSHVPVASTRCDYCRYRYAVAEVMP
jgi:CRISPR/Cas system-associated exonuclease Cas4 (RecB family)